MGDYSDIVKKMQVAGIEVFYLGRYHTEAALSMQINKSDRNDAYGLARIMQTGWYKGH